jgi:chromosome partitioning protein
MPVISFSSPKGGAGKTTAATLVASELAQRGATVTVIDADPNKNVMDWAKLGGAPQGLSVIGDVSEENIVDQIEAASEKSAFVIIDLEGTASLMNSYAISMSDLVVIPVQGSQLDAKQAARQMKLIKGQEKVVKRSIPFYVLFTRTNPAIAPRTLRHIADRFAELEVPVLETQLFDREAFRALFSFGGTLEGLADKGVSNLETAIKNARMLVAELIVILRKGDAPKKKASAA